MFHTLNSPHVTVGEAAALTRLRSCFFSLLLNGTDASTHYAPTPGSHFVSLKCLIFIFIFSICRSKEHLRPRSLGLRRLLSRRIRLQGWLWAALDAPLYSENSPSVRKGARGDSTPTARKSNMQTRRRQTPRAALFVISKQTRGHERSLLTDPSPPGLKTTVSIAQGWR